MSKHLIPAYILHKETIDKDYTNKNVLEGSQYEDHMRIEMNRFPDFSERVDYYYLEYHMLLKDVIDFLSPKYHIDIHTYECLSSYDIPNKQNFSSPDSIGIQLYSHNQNILFHTIKQALLEAVSGHSFITLG